MSPDPQPDLDALLREEPYVRALARVLCAGHEDEIVQQTWLQACAHRGKPVEKPRAWLGTIVRNVTKNVLRRETRQRSREQLAATSAVAPSSVELMQREERRRQLVELIDALPSQQREVMLLRYFEGMPPRDIATRLNLPPSTVWNLHRRALERLRHALDAAAHKRGSTRAAFLLPLVDGPFAKATPVAPLAVPAGMLAGSIAITMKTKLLTAAVVLAAVALTIYWPETAVPAPLNHDTSAGAPSDLVTADLHGAPANSGTKEDATEREVASSGASPTPTTGSVEVTVRFGGDAPAPAAHAVVTYRRSGGDFRLAPRCTADATGYVRIDDLEPGRWLFYGDRDGRPARVDVEAGSTASVEIVHDPGIHLRGIVVDEDHRPIAGARIDTAMAMMVGRDPAVMAMTDETGRFEIRDTPRPSMVGARADGFLASKMQMVFAEVGSDVEVTIVLQRGGGAVEGVVVDERGRPIPGTLVCIGEGRVQGLGDGSLDDAPPIPALVRSDDAGRFRALSVPAGEAPVWARAPDQAPWRGTCTVAAFGTSTLRIAMQRGGAIRGVVRTPDGEPVPKAYVVHGDWRQVEHAQTYGDERGAFELRGLPVGAIEIRAEHNDAGKTRETITLSSGQTLEHDLVLTRGIVLRGRVVDQDGKPVTGASVEASAKRTAKEKGWIHYVRTDDDGGFAIPNCPTGRALTVEITHKQIERYVAREVDPRNGPLDITAQRIGNNVFLVGRVLDHDGKPLAAARVAPRSHQRDQHLSPFTTEADGTFTFGPLPEGVWIVAISHPQHPSRTLESHRLGKDERWDLGDVTLELGGRAVIRSQSVPGKDLSFMIADTRSKARWSMVPADEPVTPVLRPGDYLLQAWGKRAAAQVVRFTILAGQRIEVPLHTEVGHRQRLVFDYDREQEITYGATLAVYRDGDKIVDRWLSTRPGEDWSYDLWLLPGTYRVTLSGKLRAETTLTIGDTEPAPQTIKLTRP